MLLDIRTERLPGARAGRSIYEVWLETADGARVCAGTFRLPNEAGRARVRLAAGTELASLTAIELAAPGRVDSRPAGRGRADVAACYDEKPWPAISDGS